MLFCESCGYKLENGICPNCGKGEIVENDVYCEECGTKLVEGRCPSCGKAARNYNPALDKLKSMSSTPIMRESKNRCEVCDGELYNGKCLECGKVSKNHTQNSNTDLSNSNRHIDCSQIFVSKKEKFICALGNTYLQSFVTSGMISEGFAVLSDKRVYFKGKILNLIHGNKWFMTNESKNVDIKDVTGTSVQRITRSGLMIVSCILLALAAILLLIGIADLFRFIGDYSDFQHRLNRYGSASIDGALLPLFLIIIIPSAIIGYLMLIRCKLTVLKIEFAGGCIAFDVRLYSMSECNNFQKQVRLAKDAAIEESENAAAKAMRSAVESIAVAQPQLQAHPVQQSSGNVDDLMKYAQLLEKGLITEAEYAEAKAKILSSM